MKRLIHYSHKGTCLKNAANLNKISNFYGQNWEIWTYGKYYVSLYGSEMALPTYGGITKMKGNVQLKMTLEFQQTMSIKDMKKHERLPTIPNHWSFDFSFGPPSSIF